jgi:hypothetical protein
MKGSIEVPYAIIPATPTTEAIMGKVHIDYFDGSSNQDFALWLRSFEQTMITCQFEPTIAQRIFISVLRSTPLAIIMCLYETLKT